MRKSDTQHIGEVIQEYIEALKLRGKMKKFQVRKVWPAIMGPTVAKATRHIYFKDQILFVHLTSSVLRNELYMSKTRIVKLLNGHVGTEVVKDIVFR